MPMDNRNKVDDIYIKIQNTKNINDLIGAFQLILHNLSNLSNFHIEKVKTFLNDFYTPTVTLIDIRGDKTILEDFIKDPCNIIRLKNLLTDLNDYSQSIGGNYNYLTLKSEKNE